MKTPRAHVVGPSLVILAVLLLIFAGCGAAGRIAERSSRDWYELGSQQIEKKRYKDSIESFKKAARLYRDATLDAQILMSLGDAYFLAKEFDSAIESYGEFLRLHPRNSRADRAQFRIAMSYFKQMRSEDRTQEPTRLALESFESMDRNYPRSELVAEAREKIVVCRRRLAEHELYVGRFYLRTDACEAAVPRFKRLLEEYRDLGYGDDALYFMGLCLQKVEKEEEAREVWDRLLREYPHSRYLKEISDRKG